MSAVRHGHLDRMSCAHLARHIATIEREAQHGGARGVGHSSYFRDPFGNPIDPKGPPHHPDKGARN